MTLQNFIASILLVAGFAHSASATENEVEKKFREASIQAFEEAKVRGLKEVDGVPIDRFIEAAKKTLFIYDPRITFRVGNRRCAYWHQGAKGAIEIGTGKRVDVPPQVRINTECAHYEGEDAKAIGVHEVAGVNFKKDLDYEAVMKVLGLDDGGVEGPMINPTKIRPTDARKSSGGSTVVGGGGDGDDIIFRKECHKVLKRVSSPGERLFGIPHEFYKIAFRKMKVAPASDISTLVEFRGPSVEEGGDPIAYIRSDLYRATEHGHKGLLCLSAARLFILYSPESIGLTEQPLRFTSLGLPELDRLPEFYNVPSLQVSHLIMPRGRTSPVTWKNPEINESMKEEERVKVIGRELDLHIATITDPLFKSSLIHKYRVLMRIGDELKEFTADSNP